MTLKHISKLVAVLSGMAMSLSLSAQNPVVRDQFSADPSALVVGDRVYLFPSHDIPAPDDYDRKDWFCMADYHVFSSADLVSWTDHGIILHQKDVPWGNPKAYSMWAPDCAEHNGKYYFYFPDAPAPEKGFGFRCGVAVADCPEGPYKPEENYIEGIFGIDPCIFKDDDGQGYLVWPSRGIKICKLKDNWTELDAKIVPMTPDPNLPDSIRRRIPAIPQVEGAITVDEVPTHGLVEGPYLFKANGKYYVTFPWARENTEVLAYCMADRIEGPYKFMGVFFEEHPNGCWTNHHSIVQFKGQWYLFYHHNQYSPNFDKNRSVCIDSLFFEPDGRIRPLKMTLRGVGVTTASAKIQMDRYSAVEGAGISYLDTTDCFLGWKTDFSARNQWVSYNAVSFEGTENILTARLSAPDGCSLQVFVNGQPAASLRAKPADGWQEIKVPCSPVSGGVRDVKVVSSGHRAFSLDWISFE